jgi:hypothetical protein
MAENNARTGKRRGIGRPFPPGVSGNPGGRPRGFVAAIREQTRDGEELVDFMLRVLRGQLPDVRLRDRLDAATWLTDRAFGRPRQIEPPDEKPQGESAPRLNLRDLTDEELETLAALLAKAGAPAA